MLAPQWIMNSRIVVALFAAAAIPFACGPRSRASEPSTSSTHRARLEPGEPAISSTLDVRASRRGIALTLDVANGAGKPVELNFPSGQLYDFAVLDSLNQRVWQWSDGHMFTQSIQNVVIGAGKMERFEEEWRPRGLRGHFTAVATLRSVNYPLEKRLEFALP
ncbi:MAG: hypothetical protein NVS9B3_10740 [Gemmatimonadaceae bacterium]